MGKSKSKVAAPESGKPDIKSAIKAEMVSTLPDLPNGEHVTSLSDFGYKFAGYSDQGITFGEWAKANIPGFPDAVSEEAEAEVKAGFIHRKMDLMERDSISRKYRKEGPDNWVPVPKDDTSANTVNFATTAMQLTSQQFGALRKDRPNEHKIVGSVRTEFQAYASNKWKALLRAYSDAHKEARQRAVNLTFLQAVDKALEALQKRNVVALKSHDGIGKEAMASACKAFRLAIVNAMVPAAKPAAK